MKKTILIISLILIHSCSAKIKAQRLSVSEGDKKAMSITDAWLLTDSKNAITEIMNQIKNHKGYQAYLGKFNGKQPKIFIAEIQNNTSEAYFPIQDLNDELLNEISFSGEYILIDAAARDLILKEIKYQNDGMIASEDIKQIGKASGADLIIIGNVNMKPQFSEGETIKEYSVNIRMTDIEKGIEVLRTRFRTTKYSKRSNYTW
jgi:hypothetical protein